MRPSKASAARIMTRRAWASWRMARDTTHAAWKTRSAATRFAVARALTPRARAWMRVAAARHASNRRHRATASSASRRSASRRISRSYSAHSHSSLTTAKRAAAWRRRARHWSTTTAASSSTMRAAALTIAWSASVRGSRATSRQRARAAPSHGALVKADSAAFTVRRWRAASSSTFVR